MQIGPIQFTPLNVPFQRRLQTLGVAAWIFVIVLGNVLGPILAFYLIAYTRYWWLTALYVFWIFVIDKDISEKGGRQSRWARSWLLWKYSGDYFPLLLEKLPEVELDPKKNYLFCGFPHGIISISYFHAFATEWGGFRKLFPNHISHMVTLTQNYFTPFLRDLALAVGGISSSAKSIDYVLGVPGGGHVCVLLVGGSLESYYSIPGNYTLTWKDRKGFVKLALKNGTPLVPVLSFGEIDLFDQIEIQQFRGVQEIVRKWTRLAPLILIGRGFFQYSFGILPRRRKVTVVVGVPFEVPKIDNPTRDEVDKYHSEFLKRLTQMFEEQKYNYLEKPEEKQIVIL